MTSTSHTIFFRGGLLLLLLFIAPGLGQNSQASSHVTAFQASPCQSHEPACSDDPDLLPNETGDPEAADGGTSNDDQREEEVNNGDDTEDKEDAEQILNCVFNSVPLIGGEWLTRLARLGFSDRMLIEGVHSFLTGGKLMARFIDPRGISSATRFVRYIGWCLEERTESHSDTMYAEPPSNTVEVDGATEESSDSPQRSKGRRPPSIIAQHRKKRTVKNSGYGYGSDSLLGFNLLGLLVVGALITYLVYLLTM